jgi:hypothetical protein
VDFTFLFVKGNENHGSAQKEMKSTVKRAEFVSDKISYIITRCRWFNITFLNVHAPKEDKIGDMKNSFCEKLKSVFEKFLK